MSRVTSAFIIVDYHGGVSEKMLTSYEFDNETFRHMKEGWDEASGGSKYLEVDLYTAGFNYVDGADIEAWFRSLPWGENAVAHLVWTTNGSMYGSVSINWHSWDQEPKSAL